MMICDDTSLIVDNGKFSFLHMNELLGKQLSIFLFYYGQVSKKKSYLYFHTKKYKRKENEQKIFCMI
jgi:hypothetical protein